MMSYQWCCHNTMSAWSMSDWNSAVVSYPVAPGWIKFCLCTKYKNFKISGIGFWWIFLKTCEMLRRACKPVQYNSFFYMMFTLRKIVTENLILPKLTFFPPPALASTESLVWAWRKFAYICSIQLQTLWWKTKVMP
jgi:hypothetical protein